MEVVEVVAGAREHDEEAKKERTNLLIPQSRKKEP